MPAVTRLKRNGCAASCDGLRGGIVTGTVVYVPVLALVVVLVLVVFAAMAAMAGVRYARGGWFPNVMVAAFFSSAAAMTMLVAWRP